MNIPTNGPIIVNFSFYSILSAQRLYEALNLNSMIATVAEIQSPSKSLEIGLHMHRITFLQLSMSLQFFIYIAIIFSSASAIEKILKVGIVGGGPAGLTAAATLKKLGEHNIFRKLTYFNDDILASDFRIRS